MGHLDEGRGGDLEAVHRPIVARAAGPTGAALRRLACAMEPRTYAIRTFGCQMNEHDSLRIAGLLEADGLAEAERPEDADVVVLNTCCIRENADNKLYGTLGHLKSLKAPPARPRDRGRRLPRPEGPRPGAASGRRTSTWCSAPTTCTGPRSCSTRPAPAGRSPRSSRPPRRPTTSSSRPPSPPATTTGYAAWVTIQIGCDNSCAFCIVPAVRGPEISKPFDRLVEEVRELAGEGRHRGHAARPERELLRARPGPGPAAGGRGRCGCGRCSPTSCGPSARSTASSGCASPARTRRTSAPTWSRRWPTPPAVCEHLHLPLQSGSDRVLAAMHRGYTAERYLERLPGGPGRRGRPGRHHRHHRGLPRRDRRRLRAHPRGGRRGRLRQRLHVHLLAPTGHRGGRAARRLRPGRGHRRALRPADRGGRALGPPAPRGPRRAHRGGRGRGPLAARPGRGDRPHPPEQARPLPGGARSGPAPTPPSG